MDLVDRLTRTRAAGPVRGMPDRAPDALHEGGRRACIRLAGWRRARRLRPRAAPRGSGQGDRSRSAEAAFLAARSLAAAAHLRGALARIVREAEGGISRARLPARRTRIRA